MGDAPRLSVPAPPPTQLWTLVLFASVAVLALACWLAPASSWDPRVAYGVAFGVVTAELLASTALVPAPTPKRAGLTVLVCAGLLGVLHGQAPSVGLAVVLTLALLVGASVLGALIGSRIQQPGHLLAVVGISAMMDLWSVLDSAGVSAQMAEQAAEQPAQLAVFALPWPMLGTPDIAPIIGGGDIVFAALFLTALRSHRLPVGRAVAALALAFAGGLTVLLVWERPIPLLPLLGAAVLVVEPEARRLRGRDLWVFVSTMVVIGAALAYRTVR